MVEWAERAENQSRFFKHLCVVATGSGQRLDQPNVQILSAFLSG